VPPEPCAFDQRRILGANEKGLTWGESAMVTAVRLKVLTGPHKNRRFCFCGPTRCQVGRALDCFMQFCGAERDHLISRYHCRLDIDPPLVQVGDLGSTNGTYVNGQKVGPLPKETAACPASEDRSLALNDGDLLTVGGTTLQVHIVDCPHAGTDSEGKACWDA